MKRCFFKNLFPKVATENFVDSGFAEKIKLGKELQGICKRKLGRSLAIREVDAGSCNGCELEIHALNNPIYDLERFGIRFVASPRHADLLLVTGPLTKNMAEALKRTYDCMPYPRWVVAVGDCAAGCGVFNQSYAVVRGGISALIPVDVWIYGCPPTPLELLQGLIALLGK
ncbi:NADH-quinone oxidoreductase subunit B family protein [Methylacidiphilum caldifontis]|uniref:Hydrogenase n=1 Tax=Methylacidiphilum caldifontis TaxID=2795386 RepID=A0A4Y8P9K0_9BACT|nr:NADH-quinone oxidoreductase subunit B family protein [Methylacidiphilum caldifontis]TFE66978.1 hydrogenase [Methylacidiphilum caldifontis]